MRGISFGNFLLKRVIDELLTEFPRLKSFATLSPIPGFVDWLGKLDGKTLRPLLHDRDKQDVQDNPQAGLKWVERLQKAAQGEGSEIYERVGLKLADSLLDNHERRPVD